MYFPCVVHWQTEYCCCLKNLPTYSLSDPSVYLSVVQFEGGVVVVGVVINPLVNHCHMAIDLLPPFLQRPILSTLPPAALICPAVQRRLHIFSIQFQSLPISCRRPLFHSTIKNDFHRNLLKLPGCHDDNEHVLFPHHSPEVTVGLFQWS